MAQEARRPSLKRSGMQATTTTTPKLLEREDVSTVLFWPFSVHCTQCYTNNNYAQFLFHFAVFSLFNVVTVSFAFLTFRHQLQ